MNKLYWLETIQPSDRNLVGDKAFQLGKAIQSGLPVLPGFVVPAGVFWEFLSNLQPAEPLFANLPYSSLHIDVDNPRQLQRVCQRLRQEVVNAALPLQWEQSLWETVQQWQAPAMIFRPSWVLNRAGFNSQAPTGLLEAQICPSEQQAIALSLKRTWSQLFRARSLLYWQRQGIEWQQIHLAVLVQPLWNAIASGTLTFTTAELEIKASWGLGMAITRGEVLPDCYWVDSETGAVRSQQLGNRTLAYSLVNSLQASHVNELTPLFTEPTTSYLQTYLLSETQQQQYVLNSETVQKLILLAQQLRTSLGSAFHLEWTLLQPEHNIAPQLYITQVDPIYTPALELKPQATTTPPTLIKGIGAAVGTVMATAYVIATHDQKPATLPPGSVLVASAITPDWLPLLQQAAAIVTEQGSLTCHCAILARELGIPAVVSAARATELIQTGESLLLDGEHGKIYRVRKQEQTRVTSPQMPDIASPHPVPRIPAMPIATKLLLNLSQPSLISRVKDLPIDGVGLLRSELMTLSFLAGQHPHKWLQQGRKDELVELWQEQIAVFARAFAPLPVFYRSLDWRSHEFPSLTSSSPSTAIDAANPEINPVLGQRGTLSYMRDPAIFDLELTALAMVQRSGYTNVHLLLPFVRTVEEFSFCRRRVEQAGLTQVAQFQLWIMAEVPSILFLLPQYVQAGVQGISIGTNDLTQLLLGVDRDQGELAAALNERHPAVMQAIAQIIQSCC